MDSAARIVACMQAAMMEVDVPVLEDASIRNIIGLGLPEAIRQLYPEIECGQLDRLRESYSRHFISNDIEPSGLFPKVELTLENLKLSGYTLAVATGKSRRGLNRVFRESPWGQYFSTSRCADETQSKPHPQMIHELLEETGIDAQRALMVGDTEFDMEMARIAGIDRVAVSYGVHDVKRLAEYDPVLVVDELSELHGWLGTIGEGCAID